MKFLAAAETLWLAEYSSKARWSARCSRRSPGDCAAPWIHESSRSAVTSGKAATISGGTEATKASSVDGTTSTSPKTARASAKRWSISSSEAGGPPVSD